MKKKIIAALCALLLIALLGAGIPAAFAANEQLFFTAVNDTVLALNDATMPFFSGGSLYVPYTIFDSASTGENVGLFTSYSKAKGALLIYNLSGSLLFDLNENNSVFNGTTYSHSAIIRNSTVFVPINVVCSFFNLDWAWLFAKEGSVIRLKSSTAALSDRDFATAASYTLSERLRIYQQNKEEPAVTPSPSPTVSVTPTPSKPPVTNGASVRFAFVMRDNFSGTAELLSVLEQSSVHALFLFRPDDLILWDDEVRLLVARGQQIGLFLDSDTAEGQFSQLMRGRNLLSAIAHTHTYICMSSGLTDEQLQSLGPSVLFWESDVDLTAEIGSPPTMQVTEISDAVTDGGDYFILLGDKAQAVLVLDRAIDALTLKGCTFPPVTEFSLIG